jgi:transposase InsO family protein
VPHDTRDQIVDFVRGWAERCDLPRSRFLAWLGIGASKFHDWLQRFGKVNEHNAWIPRDHWLLDDEKERICTFARSHRLEGYRSLAFMMLDQDIVACSPSSVYRVLKNAGLLAGSSPSPSKKGTGFVQPLQPHEHWHIDVSHLNIAGTYYSLCSILDGYSRYVIHWEIRETMKEEETETIVQRAREKFPNARPRIITDNGPQFVAKNFKEFIRLCGMTHVTTSPYYPQSNGKKERWYRTLKGECIRPLTPLSLEDALRIVADFVLYYNTIRLHSALGYITPLDKLEGRDPHIFAERDRKLAEARERRQQMRQTQPRPHCHPDVTDRPAIDFAAVRAQIAMHDVLQLLGFEANTARAGQLRGPCPLHGSSAGTGRCFSANLHQHHFHCFKCGRHGNALDLWAAAQRLTPYDAAVDLCRRLNLPLPTRNREEEPVAALSATCTIPPTEAKTA